MEALTREAAVLLALGEGPASGVGIRDRLASTALETSPPGPGTLYPLLRRLEQEGLVRGWDEEGRSRVGRPRRFQELTPGGIVALGRVRHQLHALGGGVVPTVPPSTVRRMRADLRRAFRVSAFAGRLADGGVGR
jgi:DNA-binding PadR family transcriptional regulator